MKVTKMCFLVAVAALLGWHAGAQTDLAPSPYCVVNGQIYDFYKSPLWRKMDGDIIKILTNGIVVETFTVRTKQQRAAQKALDDQRRAAAEKADAAKKAVQARVLKGNQDLADKGDAYGLLRMGESYRDGEGVPKDLAKARDYLTKAAAAGSPTATDELKQLPNEP
jgi:hypothetical protein